MVQWLRLHASDAGDVGLIPGQGTKIPHAMGRGQKEKKNQGPVQAEYFLFFENKMYLCIWLHQVIVKTRRLFIGSYRICNCSMKTL